MTRRERTGKKLDGLQSDSPKGDPEEPTDEERLEEARPGVGPSDGGRRRRERFGPGRGAERRETLIRTRSVWWNESSSDGMERSLEKDETERGNYRLHRQG